MEDMGQRKEGPDEVPSLPSVHSFAFHLLAKEEPGVAELRAALRCAQQLFEQLRQRSAEEAGKGQCSKEQEAPATRAAILLNRKLFRHHSRFLLLCFSAGRTDLALRYMELMPAAPRYWSRPMRAALDAGRQGCIPPLAAMREIVAAREAAGMPQDSSTASALIKAAELQGDPEEGGVNLCSAVEGAERSEAVGSAVAAHLLEQQDAAAVRDVVRKMCEAGLEPKEGGHGAQSQAIRDSSSLGHTQQPRKGEEPWASARGRPSSVGLFALHLSAKQHPGVEDLQAALCCAQQLHEQLRHRSAREAAKGRRGKGQEPPSARAAILLNRKLFKHHSRFLLLCFSTGCTDLALRYMELMPAAPRYWSLPMRATLDAGRQGTIQPLAVMKEVVAAREAAGIPQDSWTACSLISAARLQGDLQEAATIFRSSWESGKRSGAVGSAMLAVLAEHRDAAAAEDLVRQIREAGLELDEGGYGAYFEATACGGSPERVEQMLGDMADRGVRLNGRLAAAAMRAGAGCGQRDPQWFLDIYRSASSNTKGPPSSFTLSQLFSSLADCSVQSSHVEAGYEIFSAARESSSISCNSFVFTSLLALFAKRGDPFRVLEVWEDVVEEGLEHNPAVVCAVMACCSATCGREARQVAVASQVYAVRKLVWKLYDATLAAPLWPSSETIRTLAKGDGPVQPQPFVRVVSGSHGSGKGNGGGQGKEGPEVQGDSPEEGIQDSGGPAASRQALLPALNALLSYCSRDGAIEEAMAVLQCMKDGSGSGSAPLSGEGDEGPVCAGPCPDIQSFNTVMAGLASEGRHQRAAFVLAEMKAYGIEADEVTYATMLHACAEASNLQGAKEVMRSMKSSGMRPSATAYTALMAACINDGTQAAVDQVFELLAEMRAAGVQPTDVTYTVVLRACVARRDIGTAFALYEQAAGGRILLDDQCHNLLIKLCTLTGRLDEGVDMVKEVARMHGEIQSHTFNALIRALSTVSIDRALRLLSLMRTLGMKPSSATMLDLIEACANQQNPQAAFSLYRAFRSTQREVPRKTGSLLLQSLCLAGEHNGAQQVYDEMMIASGAVQVVPPSYPAASTSVSSKRGARSSGLQPQRSQRLKYHCLPTPAARSAVAYMLAQQGESERSLAVVRDMEQQEGLAGMVEAAAAGKEVFQELISRFCRQGRIDDALYVFDAWKAAFAQITPERAYSCRLNSAVLAFLEASCKSHTKYHWRVYDVLAVMRRQREISNQVSLEQPPKRSHHFTDEYYPEEQLDDDDMYSDWAAYE